MHSLALLLLASLLGAQDAAAPRVVPSDPVGTAIRISDTRLAALLAEGVRRSPTLRSVVEGIEAGDVIVFVQTVRWLPRELMGVVTGIGASPPYRYLHIMLKTQSSDLLLASLGHELRHVLEVVEAPGVSDDRSLLALYQHIGRPTNAAQSSWDTAEARWTGDQVLRELKGQAAPGPPRPASADSGRRAEYRRQARGPSPGGRIGMRPP